MDILHSDNITLSKEAAIKWNPEKYDTANNCIFDDAVYLIKKVLEHNYGITGAIFEIGCGSGNITNVLSKSIPHQKIISCDICPEMIDFASKTYNQLKRIKFIVQDFGLKWNNLDEEIQNLEGTVGMVFSNYTIHLIRNKATCVANISRLLKSGGICCLNIPHIPFRDDSELDIEFLEKEKFLNWLPEKEQFKEYERLVSMCGMKILETDVDYLEYTFPNLEEFNKMFGPVAKACANAVLDMNIPAELRKSLLEKCERVYFSSIIKKRADSAHTLNDDSICVLYRRKRIICYKK